MDRIVARPLLSSLLLILFVASIAAAQAPTTGRLTGTVKDPSGAVIPGAEILAKKPGEAPVTALAWSGDGRLLAWGTESGEAGIVNLG